MSNYFPCKYPILMAPMNGCSTVNLAAAAHEAEIFPSIVPASKNFYDKLNFSNSSSDIEFLVKEFYKLTNSKNLLLQLAKIHFKNNDLVKFLLDFKPSHIFYMKSNPFYTSDEEENLNSINDEDINDNITNLLKNTKIVTNIKLDACKKISPYDAYIITGNNKAGLCGNLNLEEYVVKQKNLEPKFPIIASGGIYCSSQIKNLLNLGASSVAIGTMFAASKESDLSEDAKNKIINSSYSEIKKFEHSNQNVLLIKETKHPEIPIDPNSTYSLYNGVYGNLSKGHIPIGPGVDYINQILPIKEIVRMLVEDL